MSYKSASALWMGDVDPFMDERFIREAFSIMGEHVVSVKLLKDHKTGQPRNYCFVELTSRDAVALCINRLAGLPLPNYPAKKFKLNYSLRDHNTPAVPSDGSGTATAVSASPYGKEYSVYVGGLSFSTTDQELLQCFSHYQTLKEAKVVRDDNQKSKGFAFVRFYTEQDQEAAILQMNGAVGPAGVTMRVDKAMPKREKEQLQQQQSTAEVVPQQQQYPTAYPAQTQPQPQAQVHPVTADKQEDSDDDEVLEDHSAPVNMVATNLAFIAANQEFYTKLEESRWHPVTSYTATIEEVCK